MGKGIVLYRGIAVEKSKVEEIISQIKENGLIGDEGFLEIYWIESQTWR